MTMAHRIQITKSFTLEEITGLSDTKEVFRSLVAQAKGFYEDDVDVDSDNSSYEFHEHPKNKQKVKLVATIQYEID